MAYFQTDLGKFWRVLQWTMLVNFRVVWSILWRFGIFGGHFGTFNGYFGNFSRFGIFYQEKSGNPGSRTRSPDAVEIASSKQQESLQCKCCLRLKAFQRLRQCDQEPTLRFLKYFRQKNWRFYSKQS
jgi:hypothetical protein